MFDPIIVYIAWRLSGRLLLIRARTAAGAQNESACRMASRYRQTAEMPEKYPSSLNFQRPHGQK
jgi:hypothetical protein